MNEDRRLRDKLARLAAGDDGRPDASRDPLRALLLEIDETILPRALAFTADTGSLVIEVANRRLQTVVSLPADLARDGVIGQLSPDDAEALAAVAGALGDFARRHRGFTVTARPLAGGLDSSGHGRSAAALAEAAGIDLYDAPAPAPVPAPDPARGFEPGLARLALASAAVADGMASAATGPDADAVRRLSALSPAPLAALMARLGPAAARPGRFLLVTGGDEALFLGQTEAARAVLALIPADHAGAVVALWHATRARV